MPRKMATFLAVLLLFVPAFAYCQQDKATEPECKVHPHSGKVGDVVLNIRGAIFSYHFTYGDYPGRLEQLGPPAAGGPTSREAAGLLREGPLNSELAGYRFRYERTEAGWRLWATPIDPEEGCGSYFTADGGLIHFREKTGEASEDDPAQVFRIRIGGSAMRGNLKKSIQPSYPLEARAQHVEGSVVLKLLVDREGKVGNVQALSGPDLLVPAAIEAVKQWEYRPINLEGIPVEVETTAEVAFNLGR